MGDALLEYLRQCCRQVFGERPGAGFFVTPTVLVTCTHVVGQCTPDTKIKIKNWALEKGSEFEWATVLRVCPEEDLAVLEVLRASEDYAPAGADARLKDTLVAVGFPRRSDRDEFDQFSAIYEGPTQFPGTSGRPGVERKFKEGQVEPGFSGGPLLNLRTNRIMGVVVATRNRASALGGWAVDAQVIARILAELRIALPPPSAKWLAAAYAQHDMASRLAVPFQAPPLPPHHVGREQARLSILDQISSDSQISGTTGGGVTVIQGSGGVGKTTLAASVAHSDEIRSRFPDGVYWVTLGTEPQLLPLLTSWIQATGEQSSATWSIASATGYLRSALRERSALLIIDDVWDEEHARAFMVGGPRCHTVLTLRRAHITNRLGGYTLSLNEMTAAESFELLTTRARQRNNRSPLSADDRKQALLLSQDLGHLALAIELAGALIARGYSWQAARNALLDERARQNFDPGDEHPAHRTISICLSVSLRVLRKEYFNAWRAFITLAILPPGQRISPQMAANIWGLGHQNDAEYLLSALADEALLQRVGDYYTAHSHMHRMGLQLLRLPTPEGLGLQLQDEHAVVVRRYQRLIPEGRWDRLPDDGYIHSRLIWHMEHAGEIQSLFNLLTLQDEKGHNAWFRCRNDLGQIAGYVEDLRTAQRLARTHFEHSISQQLIWTLCLSSIQSSTRNYTPELVFALVSAALWSPVRAYQWILEVCSVDSRPGFLISLARCLTETAPERNTDPKQVERIRRDALDMARRMLGDQRATEHSTRLMGDVIVLLDTQERQKALTEALGWCGTVKLRVTLLQRHNLALHEDLLEDITQSILALKNSEQVVLLVDMIPVLPASYKSRYLQAIWAAARKLVATTTSLAEKTQKPSQSTDETQADWDGTPPLEQRTGALQVVPDTNEDDQEAQRKLGHDQERALALSIGYLPREGLLEHERTIRSLHSARLTEAYNEQLAALSYSRSRRKAEEDDPDGRKKFAQVLKYKHFNSDEALEISFQESESLLNERIGTVAARMNPSRIDELCGNYAARLRKLPREIRHSIALTLHSRNPKALGPRMLEIGAREKPAGTSPDLLDEIRRLKFVDRDLLMSSIYLGERHVAEAVLQQYSRIGDRNEEAGAVFALLPYLPRSFPRELVSDLQNNEQYGDQIAGLTQIVLSLVSALGAGALEDVVESASKLHSEWWVVEAMTMALLHAERAEEFEAIWRASRHIKNLDLRARMVERLARREADFGLAERAIRTAGMIELPSSRWPALADIAKRCGSVGDATHARAAAEAISSVEERSKAYLDIALELGALGGMAEAHQIIETDIVSPKWRAAARTMMGTSPTIDGSTVDQTRMDERLSFRRRREQLTSQRTKGEKSIEQATQLIGTAGWMDGVRKALATEDPAALQQAMKWMWNDDPSALSLTLSTDLRPRVLQVITALAPLLCANQEDDALVAVRAIRNTCRWWP